MVDFRIEIGGNTRKEKKNVVYELDSNTLSLLSTIKFQYCTFIYMGKVILQYNNKMNLSNRI